MDKNLYFLLDLKDNAELIQRYRDLHAPGAVPAGVTKSIKDAGVDALEIFLVGNRMLMVLTPGAGFEATPKAAADAGNLEVVAWETLMWEFQQALPFAKPGEKWVPLQRIFTLSEQS